MSEHPEPDTCVTVDELLEPYLDDALTTAARARVDRHLTRCAACAGELAIARELRATLRALPAQTCPPAVTATVLAHARADDARRASANGASARVDDERRAAPAPDRADEVAAPAVPGPAPVTVDEARRAAPAPDRADDARPEGLRALWRRLWPAPAARWQPAAALVALAVVGLVLVTRPARQSTVPVAETVRAEEIARAEDDVKLALAYLGRIGAQTGAIVRQEVFEERLAPPIAHSLRHALPIAYLPAVAAPAPPPEPGSEEL